MLVLIRRGVESQPVVATSRDRLFLARQHHKRG